MALTLALLGYTMIDSSNDKPTPMQIPLILLMVTCNAPAHKQHCWVQHMCNPQCKTVAAMYALCPM